MDSPFDFFLKLVNSNINKAEDTELVALLFDYARHMGQLVKGMPFVSADRYDEVMTGLTSDADVMAERRQGLLKVQKYLVSFFESTNEPGDKSLIKMSGKQELVVKNGQFSFQFTPASFKGEHLDWNEEKTLVSIVFMDLVRELDLLPGRIKKCEWCESYFYQESKMDKKFCSTKCGNASRQARHTGLRFTEVAKGRARVR